MGQRFVSSVQKHLCGIFSSDSYREDIKINEDVHARFDIRSRL